MYCVFGAADCGLLAGCWFDCFRLFCLWDGLRLALLLGENKVVWGSRLQGGSHDELLAVAVDPGSGDVFAAGFTSDGLGM